MADKNENGSAFDLLGQFDIAPIKAVKDTPFEFITNSAFFMILTVAVIAVLMLVFPLARGWFRVAVKHSLRSSTTSALAL